MPTAAPVARTPLRTVRRSRVFLGIGLCRDARERVVGDDGEDQIAQLVAGRVERRRPRVQRASIHVALLITHGVAEVLLNQTLGDGDALTGGDAETAGVGDGLPVERAGRVDRQPVVGGPVLSDRIVTFQREPERVHERVTRGAPGGGPMRLEPLALRHRDAGRLIDRRRVDARWRRRNGQAHQRFTDELAPQRRGARLLVRELGQQGRLAQNSRPRTVRGQRGRLERRRGEAGGVEAVERREIRVHDDLRAREQVHRARLIVERQRSPGVAHVADHRGLQVRTVRGEQRWVLRLRDDPVEAHVLLGEARDGFTPGGRRVQHPRRRGADPVRRGEHAARRLVHQPLVRKAVPDQERKTPRHLVSAEPQAPACGRRSELGAINEIRRLEQLHRRPPGALDRAAQRRRGAGGERSESVELRARERTAPRAKPELLNVSP